MICSHFQREKYKLSFQPAALTSEEICGFRRVSAKRAGAGGGGA